MRHVHEHEWFKWVLTTQGIKLESLEAPSEDRKRTFMREMPPGVPCPVYTLGEIMDVVSLINAGWRDSPRGSGEWRWPERWCTTALAIQRLFEDLR